MDLIEFHHVSFQYGENPLLHDVTFNVKQGEYIGLIGPNGGGKTTLLKLLLGLLEPDSGTIRNHLNTEQIGYVPQRLHLDPLFPITVLDVVLLGTIAHLPWWGRYKTEEIEKAYDALRTVRLEGLAKQPFGTLSMGQGQRVLIARALASDPKLLILDEPTASVDPQSAYEIYELLKKLKGSITIVMVTHDLKTVIKETDRVLTVHREVQSMKPEEVCEHFAYGLYHTPMIPEVNH